MQEWAELVDGCLMPLAGLELPRLRTVALLPGVSMAEDDVAVLASIKVCLVSL